MGRGNVYLTFSGSFLSRPAGAASWIFSGTLEWSVAWETPWPWAFCCAADILDYVVKKSLD